eukprot:CAMPEP_0175937692 /NCGR_PEP_ID=MMETSP0108-20121206/22284_1 /TAXON_ID=195067 ORGANISM="Goniomonas pacifica, Strain CCMP1869" /NCGR_SAMPLE_ID=MMETSP0108 /ASSEMBLY_ACC=CAM_ASM_000204 /LENGTH=149 /DNA_ID=CAMNT_0017261865 /DNA_START=188 /DNA_END=636 /DNA_ORIENTATION=-
MAFICSGSTTLGMMTAKINITPIMITIGVLEIRRDVKGFSDLEVMQRLGWFKDNGVGQRPLLLAVVGSVNSNTLWSLDVLQDDTNRLKRVRVGEHLYEVGTEVHVVDRKSAVMTNNSCENPTVHHDFALVWCSAHGIIFASVDPALDPG